MESLKLQCRVQTASSKWLSFCRPDVTATGPAALPALIRSHLSRPGPGTWTWAGDLTLIIIRSNL